MGLLGVETQAAWLTEPAIALFAVAMVTVWKAAPYYMIIYLAGLQGIPAQLKEAARVDGAGWWQVVRHVIIPTIQPYTLVVSIIATIAALRTFGEVYVMTAAAAPSTAPIYWPITSTHSGSNTSK